MAKPTDAETIVMAHLAGCLPPETPPCVRSCISARYEGGGRKRVAVAEVEMFDGLHATVEVFKWRSGAFGHRWAAMPGGAVFFEDGRWQRDAEDAAAEWRPIEETPGKYDVSNMGRVRSLFGPRGTRRTVPHLLAVTGDGFYYPRVNLRFDGRVLQRLVHLLVLKAFRGPCPEGMEGSHLDDNPANNRLENLVWESRPDNLKRRRVPVGDNARNRKLTSAQVAEIRELRANTGVSYRTIGKQFGISDTMARYIVNRHSWQHNGGTKRDGVHNDV